MKKQSMTAWSMIPVAAVLAFTAVRPGVSEPVVPVADVVQPALETVPAGTYDIDVVHSELTFRIRHLIGRVAGTFTEWEGTLELDPTDLSKTSLDVVIQTGSINTLQEQRDDHLRSSDFFAADSFPTMEFRSREVEATGNRLKVHGDLTIRGVTRPVVLDAYYLGLMEADPWGMERVAFLASTTVDRQDFGVSYNEFLETMSMIGDEVEIEVAFEAVLRQP